METQFYIARGQATQGPFSITDIQTYLAYGSIAEMDLVLRDGTEEWVPVSSLPELSSTHPTTGKNGTKKNAIRRRTARYRDYHRVPVDHRSGTTLRRLCIGFLFWPPTLWKGSAAIFTNYIYRPAKDEAGYLRIWPRWVEAFVSILVVINIIVWVVGCLWLTHHAAPIARDISDVVRDGMKELEAWLNTSESLNTRP